MQLLRKPALMGLGSRRRSGYSGVLPLLAVLLLGLIVLGHAEPETEEQTYSFKIMGTLRSGTKQNVLVCLFDSEDISVLSDIFTEGGSEQPELSFPATQSTAPMIWNATVGCYDADLAIGNIPTTKNYNFKITHTLSNTTILPFSTALEQPFPSSCSIEPDLLYLNEAQKVNVTVLNSDNLPMAGLKLKLQYPGVDGTEVDLADQTGGQYTAELSFPSGEEEKNVPIYVIDNAGGRLLCDTDLNVVATKPTKFISETTLKHGEESSVIIKLASDTEPDAQWGDILTNVELSCPQGSSINLESLGVGYYGAKVIIPSEWENGLQQCSLSNDQELDLWGEVEIDIASPSWCSVMPTDLYAKPNNITVALGGDNAPYNVESPVLVFDNQVTELTGSDPMTGSLSFHRTSTPVSGAATLYYTFNGEKQALQCNETLQVVQLEPTDVTLENQSPAVLGQETLLSFALSNSEHPDVEVPCSEGWNIDVSGQQIPLACNPEEGKYYSTLILSSSDEVSTMQASIVSPDGKTFDVDIPVVKSQYVSVVLNVTSAVEGDTIGVLAVLLDKDGQVAKDYKITALDFDGTAVDATSGSQGSSEFSITIPSGNPGRSTTAVVIDGVDEPLRGPDIQILDTSPGTWTLTPEEFTAGNTESISVNLEADYEGDSITLLFGNTGFSLTLNKDPDDSFKYDGVFPKTAPIGQKVLATISELSNLNGKLVAINPVQPVSARTNITTLIPGIVNPVSIELFDQDGDTVDNAGIATMAFADASGVTALLEGAGPYTAYITVPSGDVSNPLSATISSSNFPDIQLENVFTVGSTIPTSFTLTPDSIESMSAATLQVALFNSTDSPILDDSLDLLLKIESYEIPLTWDSGYKAELPEPGLPMPGTYLAVVEDRTHNIQLVNSLNATIPPVSNFTVSPAEVDVGEKYAFEVALLDNSGNTIPTKTDAILTFSNTEVNLVATTDGSLLGIATVDSDLGEQDAVLNDGANLDLTQEKAITVKQANVTVSRIEVAPTEFVLGTTVQIQVKLFDDDNEQVTIPGDNPMLISSDNEEIPLELNNTDSSYNGEYFVPRNLNHDVTYKFKTGNYTSEDLPIVPVFNSLLVVDLEVTPSEAIEQQVIDIIVRLLGAPVPASRMLRAAPDDSSFNGGPISLTVGDKQYTSEYNNETDSYVVPDVELPALSNTTVLNVTYTSTNRTIRTPITVYAVNDLEWSLQPRIATQNETGASSVTLTTKDGKQLVVNTTLTTNFPGGNLTYTPRAEFYTSTFKIPEDQESGVYPVTLTINKIPHPDTIDVTIELAALPDNTTWDFVTKRIQTDQETLVSLKIVDANGTVIPNLTQLRLIHNNITACSPTFSNDEYSCTIRANLDYGVGNVSFALQRGNEFIEPNRTLLISDVPPVSVLRLVPDIVTHGYNTTFNATLLNSDGEDVGNIGTLVLRVGETTPIEFKWDENQYTYTTVIPSDWPVGKQNVTAEINGIPLDVTETLEVLAAPEPDSWSFNTKTVTSGSTSTLSLNVLDSATKSIPNLKGLELLHNGTVVCSLVYSEDAYTCETMIDQTWGTGSVPFELSNNGVPLNQTQYLNVVSGAPTYIWTISPSSVTQGDNVTFVFDITQSTARQSRAAEPFENVKIMVGNSIYPLTWNGTNYILNLTIPYDWPTPNATVYMLINDVRIPQTNTIAVSLPLVRDWTLNTRYLPACSNSSVSFTLNVATGPLQTCQPDIELYHDCTKLPTPTCTDGVYRTIIETPCNETLYCLTVAANNTVILPSQTLFLTQDIVPATWTLTPTNVQVGRMSQLDVDVRNAHNDTIGKVGLATLRVIGVNSVDNIDVPLSWNETTQTYRGYLTIPATYPESTYQTQLIINDSAVPGQNPITVGAGTDPVATSWEVSIKGIHVGPNVTLTVKIFDDQGILKMDEIGAYLAANGAHICTLNPQQLYYECKLSISQLPSTNSLDVDLFLNDRALGSTRSIPISKSPVPVYVDLITSQLASGMDNTISFRLLDTERVPTEDLRGVSVQFNEEPHVLAVWDKNRYTAMIKVPSYTNPTNVRLSFFYNNNLIDRSNTTSFPALSPGVSSVEQLRANIFPRYYVLGVPTSFQLDIFSSSSLISSGTVKLNINGNAYPVTYNTENAIWISESVVQSEWNGTYSVQVDATPSIEGKVDVYKAPQCAIVTKRDGETQTAFEFMLFSDETCTGNTLGNVLNNLVLDIGQNENFPVVWDQTKERWIATLDSPVTSNIAALKVGDIAVPVVLSIPSEVIEISVVRERLEDSLWRFLIHIFSDTEKTTPIPDLPNVNVIIDGTAYHAKWNETSQSYVTEDIDLPDNWDDMVTVQFRDSVNVFSVESDGNRIILPAPKKETSPETVVSIVLGVGIILLAGILVGVLTWKKLWCCRRKSVPSVAPAPVSPTMMDH